MRRFSLALLLVCLATSVEAAIAKREIAEGHTSGAPTTSCATGTFVTSPVTGDTIVVGVSTFGLGITISAPTDTQSNTYTQIGTTTTTANNAKLAVYRSENVTGGASFVVTGHASGNGCTAIVWALSGAATTSYNGDSIAATNTGANPASGTSTPAPAANSFFIGAMTNESTNAVTAGSGWQFETRSTQTDNTSFQDLFTEDLTTGTSSSAQNATFTEASDTWADRVQSFAPAGGAATPMRTLLGVGTHARR